MLRAVLALLASLSLVGAGFGTLVAPDLVASLFGVPAEDSTAKLYLRGIGSRDAVLGLLISTLLMRRDRPALVTTFQLTAFAGASDFALVAALRKKSAAPNLMLHVVGILGLIGLSLAFSEDGP